MSLETTLRKEHPDISKYLSDNEQLESVQSRVNRTFIVTDQRVVDIRQGRSDEDESETTVVSTLFDNIARVDITARESGTEKQNSIQVVGAFLVLIGAILLLISVFQGGFLAVIGGILGLGLAGLGVWSLNNFDSKVNKTTGGTIVRFRHAHATAEENIEDIYTLPDESTDSAEAIISAVGGHVSK